jgi:hypothetical protein
MTDTHSKATREAFNAADSALQERMAEIAREQPPAVIPGRILGAYIAATTSMFLSFIALWPLLFTPKQAFGTFGMQFSTMVFWAVPAAIASLVLALGYRRRYWQTIGLAKVVGALVASSVALITALVVTGVLFTQLP